MKKILVLVLISAVLLTGCSSKDSETQDTQGAGMVLGECKGLGATIEVTNNGKTTLDKDADFISNPESTERSGYIPFSKYNVKPGETKDIPFYNTFDSPFALSSSWHKIVDSDYPEIVFECY